MMNAISQFLSLRDVVALGGASARMRMNDAALAALAIDRILEHEVATLTNGQLDNCSLMEKPSEMRGGIFALCTHERLLSDIADIMTLVIPGGPYNQADADKILPDIIARMICDGEMFEVVESEHRVSRPILGDAFVYFARVPPPPYGRSRTSFAIRRFNPFEKK